MRALLSPVVTLFAVAAACAAETARPNFLWITSEDNAPSLGCYGDAYATTPNLDALAAAGTIYRHVWCNAPVCAPARTAIITGVCPTSLGAEHMRSLVPLPADMRMFPAILREAGYYCTNNSKEDYNVEKSGRVWDESSPRAHWKKRAPGQPFFAVFNITLTHESQIRKRPHEWKHDPAKARVPAYHPDTPETRQDWAQYYDQMTEMDAVAGARLRELADANLADDTIVFYYGDNGPGLPRCKRSPCNSGLHVPLIVRVPPKFRPLASKDYTPGGSSERLVSFIDLAPTILSLAGLTPPDRMHGRAFLGPGESPPPPFLYGFRGRMDERYDLVRSIRDDRYVYVRNFMPHRPAGQHNAYMFETPMTRAWKTLYDQNKLAPPTTFFWELRQPEELYDLHSDPDEVRNLAPSAEHRETLTRMRRALHEHLLAIRDVGLLPEGEIHERSAKSTPHAMGHDDRQYPIARILAMAESASSLDPAATSRLQAALLGEDDSAVRWWAAIGILMRGEKTVASSLPELRRALNDKSPYVRIAAAEALGRYAEKADLDTSLRVLLELADLRKHGVYTALYSLNTIDTLGPAAAPIKNRVAALPRSGPGVIARMDTCVPKLLDALPDSLQQSPTSSPASRAGNSQP